MNDEVKKQIILIVDDVPQNISVLEEILKSDYEIYAARDGRRALSIAQGDNAIDLILLDIMMPGMDGFEVCSKLKTDEKTKQIPVIFVTAKGDLQDEKHGLELGAVDYVTKPVNPSIVLTRVKNHLELKKHRDHLEELVKERTKELALTQEITIESMGTLAEYRDPETGGHIKRTQHYVKALAEHLKDHNAFNEFMESSNIDLLYVSTPLHDIGKVGVRDSILLKPGKLSSEEFEEMKKHTIIGHDAIQIAEKKLGENSFLHFARTVAYTHHEKWDGSGYPQGLAGEDIPISGRLMALADVYDALISKRVYKPPFSHSKAVQIIKEGKGKHFDPEMVDIFVEIQETFRGIAHKFADFEEERDMLNQK